MTLPHIFATQPAGNVPASYLDDDFNFITGNGAFSYLSTSPDYQFLFKASGSHYYDGNIALQNTTHTGGQVGNAAITLLNGIDGNQFSAFGGNMTDTGNPELALTYIGLGDLGGVSAPRFHYQFILNVNNGPNSLDFPNATYNAFIFDGQSGVFQFRDHLSQGVLTVNAEAHVVSVAGVQNFLEIFGGGAPGAPMTIGVAGADTDVGLVFTAKGAGNVEFVGATVLIPAPLDTSTTNPLWIQNKSASGGVNTITGQTNGSGRWSILLGNATAESGANAGSDFQIGAYSDAGGFLGFPIIFERSSQRAIFAASIQTAAPSGSSAGLWKLGSIKSGAVVLDTSRSVQLDIGGTVYNVMVST